MKFIPFYDKIEIRPLDSSGVIQSSDRFEEVGEVIAVGRDVKDFREGDIVCFVSHGCWKTPKDSDGVTHYVVPVNSQFILGQYAK